MSAFTFKDDFLNKIMIPVIVSIITSVIAFSIWFFQYGKNKNDTLKSTKIEMVEKVSKSLIKMNNLTNYHLRLGIYKEQFYLHFKDSLKTANLAPDQLTSIENSLMKERPELYAEYNKAIEFKPEVMSTLLSTQFFFGKSTQKAVSQYMPLLSVYDYAQTLKKPTIKDVDVNVECEKYDSILKIKSTLIIQEMTKDIMEQ